MAYALWDDEFHSSRKVVDLFDGPCPADAIALYALALSWSSSALTDGVIGPGFVKTKGFHKKAADELVRVTLWDKRDDGTWYIHNYLKRNPSKAQVIAKRELEAERKRNGRANQSRDPETGRIESSERSPENVRPESARTNDGRQPESNRCPTGPNPLPLPSKNFLGGEDLDLVARSSAQSSDPDLPPDPDLVWLTKQAASRGWMGSLFASERTKQAGCRVVQLATDTAKTRGMPGWRPTFERVFSAWIAEKPERINLPNWPSKLAEDWHQCVTRVDSEQPS